MITGADRAVLTECYRNAHVGRDAINMLISKVEDEDLALDLNRQACRFLRYEEQVGREFEKEKEEMPHSSVFDRTKLWSGIQMNTLLNTSTPHLADMLIRGNAMGITDLMKAVKENCGAQKEYCEMAQEIMDFEEKNMEKLRAYL
ncbi:MAG: hypothetical protein LUD73_00095 [Lachnospiraceae bacterium]|nr:hypothetical protein [Lachnospiraceae bacterium]MCD8248941.1 hypothetical protein [Lachnospiraceae bacterium]